MKRKTGGRTTSEPKFMMRLSLWGAGRREGDLGMPRDRVTKEKRAAAKAAKDAETAELKARLTAAVARMDMELEPPPAPSSVPALTAVPAPTAVPAATTDFPALNTVPAPIAANALEEEEVDTALVVQECAARFGGMSSLSLRPSHLVAYEKFMAAQKHPALWSCSASWTSSL